MAGQLKTKYRWLEFEKKYDYWRCERMSPRFRLGLIVFSDQCEQWHFLPMANEFNRNELNTIADFVGQLNKVKT